MNDEARRELVPPPGTERPRRYRPKLRYELIGCGLHSHELLGTDAARLRPEDGLFAREADVLRWYRCLRCDSWVALRPPSQPSVQYPPRQEDVALPLRGRALRDRYVLRLIALDRLHLVRTATRRPHMAFPVPTTAPAPSGAEKITWLQPYPDALLDGVPDSGPGPDARAEQDEAVSLALSFQAARPAGAE